MRFDEAFLSTFGQAFDRGMQGEMSRRAREQASAEEDARLEKHLNATAERDKRVLEARTGERKDEQRLRAEERAADIARRDRERAEEVARRERERGEDRGERESYRKESREEAEYTKSYTRALNAFSNADPMESAARIRPLFTKAAQGGALSPAEKAELDAGRDVYGMLRKQATTPRTIEQTVKGPDPTDPTRDVYQKVRVPDPGWKPTPLPSFEEIMMPEAAKFMNPGPISPAFNAPGAKAAPAPSPMQRSGIASQVFSEEAAKRKAIEAQKQALRDEELNRLRAQDYGQWMT